MMGRQLFGLLPVVISLLSFFTVFPVPGECPPRFVRNTVVTLNLPWMMVGTVLRCFLIPVIFSLCNFFSSLYSRKGNFPAVFFFFSFFFFFFFFLVVGVSYFPCLVQKSLGITAACASPRGLVNFRPDAFQFHYSPTALVSIQPVPLLFPLPFPIKRDFFWGNGSFL